jgi:hypothetical protein
MRCADKKNGRFINATPQVYLSTILPVRGAEEITPLKIFPQARSHNMVERLCSLCKAFYVVINENGREISIIAPSSPPASG